MTKVTAKATITIEIDGQEIELSLAEVRELYSQLRTILNITDGGFGPSITPPKIEDWYPKKTWTDGGTGEPPPGYKTSLSADLIGPGKQLDMWFENSTQQKLRGVETS